MCQNSEAHNVQGVTFFPTFSAPSYCPAIHGSSALLHKDPSRCPARLHSSFAQTRSAGSASPSCPASSWGKGAPCCTPAATDSDLKLLFCKSLLPRSQAGQI